jgi:nicotinate-nucleotide adenylyltransferase
MRIAVFGGTFDPPHVGHISLAETVVSGGYADKILFVPAYCPPHKTGVPVTDFKHRLAMLELAVGQHEKFEISLIEKDEARVPSYTFDTMLSLEKKYPGDELMIMIGGDSLVQLHLWRLAGELVRRWPIITYPRAESVPLREELGKYWNEHELELILGSVVKADCVMVSSTEIRERLANGEKVDNLVAKNVNEYIFANNLYNKN